jgi:hypothetical protein
MQDYMKCGNKYENQCGPLMHGRDKMPQRDKQATPCFISSGQYKPIQQAGNTQNDEDNKGYHIHDPKL